MRTTWMCVLAAGLAGLCSTVPAWAQDADVRGEGLAQTLDCAGGPASVQGNGNHLVFRGRCSGLDVRGEGNAIDIDLAPGASVVMEGNGNRLRYAGGSRTMSVAARGEGNEVNGQPVATVSGMTPPVARRYAGPGDPVPLLLTGDGQRRDTSCTDRDVQIQGNGAAITLRGGCRSVTVQGNGVQVQAELAPGARVVIQGNGDLLTYELSAAGPEPAVSVQGNGSYARRGS